MSHRLRALARPSNLIALLALFVALGSTSYALTIPRNSVGTAQLKGSAVTGLKVKDRSLKAGDFARGQLPKGDAGPAGPSGPKGDTGPTGAQGPAGTALAFAQINGTGSLVGSRTRNIADSQLSHPATGVYCISGMSKANNVTATLNPPPVPVKLLIYASLDGTFGCQGGETVINVTDTNGNPIDQTFYVAFN